MATTVTTLKIEFSKLAVKQFKKYEKKMQQKFITAIESLDQLTADVKPLHGELKDTYRLRVGEYRILFQKDKENAIIYIAEIGSRNDIYK